MTLGEKIQKLRKQKGLSQEALAEKVTVTRQPIICQKKLNAYF